MDGLKKFLELAINGNFFRLKPKASIPAILKNYQKYVFKPTVNKQGNKEEDISEELMRWTLENEVEHMCFISFPSNSTICRKEDSLLELKKENGQLKPVLILSKDMLLKAETDGSSFPSGGLRGTHHARAYTVRDPLSDIFIKKSEKLLCIPSLLVTHKGEALDDKTVFRKSQKIMKDTAMRLFKTLKKDPKQIFFNLGLQQQFFVIPKEAYLQRPDLLHCNRILVGEMGAKHQQFSDHYFAQIPPKLKKVFEQIQTELLEIGIPFKTKHNEVANCQFQFTSNYCEAGKAIDQNLMIMQIMKEVMDRYGLTCLLHEKPFLQINGSGKHANWSFGYIDNNGTLKNVFSLPKREKNDKYDEDVRLFKLFMLIILTAVQKHNALYFGSVAVPGNEVRLGGHEAPPRVVSAYLGAAVNAVIDDTQAPGKINLKSVLPFLKEDVFQDDSDRNRTSAFAYTGHKFEFRALGSSQNPAWPIAVICATMAKEMMEVEKKLKNGVSVDEIINDLREETKKVRYQGNGYSQEWKDEAKKRGLYVNQSFSQLYERLDKDVAVFVDIGACTKREIQARCDVMRDVYKLTVETQAKALLNLASQKIIPRAMAYLKVLLTESKTQEKFIDSYIDEFKKTLNDFLRLIKELEEASQKCADVKEAESLRKKVIEIGSHLGAICKLLPKDPTFPDLEDFLLF